MDKFKYVFFPNPDTGLTIWARIPLGASTEFEQKIAPLLPKVDARTREILNQTGPLPQRAMEILAGEWEMEKRRPEAGGIAPSWEMVSRARGSYPEGNVLTDFGATRRIDINAQMPYEGVSKPLDMEFPELPGIEDTNLGFAWGALAAVIVAAINAASSRAGGGGATGQSAISWYEFVAKMGCNKLKYCYCCCPLDSSGNCYRVEFRDMSYFEMLPRERGKGMGEPNPRFDCRLLPEAAFKQIPNCGKRIEEGSGEGGKYPSPPENGEGAEWLKKYGLWIAGGFLVFILFKDKQQPEYEYVRGGTKK